MEKENWAVICGTSNLGEDNSDTVCAIMHEELCQVSYPAYAGLKILTLTGITDIAEGNIDRQDLEAVSNAVGDFWDVVFRAETKDKVVLVVVNECEGVTLIDLFTGEEIENKTVEVDCAEEYDATMYGEVDEDLLYLYDYL